MKSFNLNRLYYFHTFVRKNNVVNAAKELYISQPALSAQLKQLENELDVTLFDRSTRNLELTEKGQNLYHYTKKIFETCESLFQELTPNRAVAPSLKIGVTEQIERPFSVQFVSSLYKDNFPLDAKRFHVTSSAYEALLSNLQNGKLDLVLSHEVTENEQVVALAKYDVPVVLALPRSYGGRRTPAVSEECLNAIASHEINMVMPASKLSLRKRIDEFLIERQIRPQIVFESDILAVVIRAISDGIGAGFIPLPYLTQERTEGRIKIAGLPSGYWTETLWLLANRKYLEGMQSDSTKKLINSFIEVCNTQG